MRDKCLPLYLPDDLYAEIERRGRAQERDPIQEARFIIRAELERTAMPVAPDCAAEPAVKRA